MDPDATPSSEVPVVVPEMTFERAEEVLKEDQHRQHVFIDNVYPWWQTLRWPLLVLSLVFGVLCLSVIFLSVSVKQAVGDTEQEQLSDACYDEFTVDNAEASADVRRQGSKLDSAGWLALVSSVSGADVDQAVVDNIEKLGREVEIAVENEAAALQARQDWLDNGRPLPCPVGG